MEDITRTIEVLTSLIAVNNHRIKAYQTLEHKTNKEHLRAVCKLHIDQSKRFVQSLSTWRAAYGGFAVANRDAGTTSSWAQVRSMLDFGRSEWKRCEDQDKETIKIYRSALKNSFLPIATREDIQDQVKGLEKALATFKRLSDQPHSINETGYQPTEHRWR